MSLEIRYVIDAEIGRYVPISFEVPPMAVCVKKSIERLTHIYRS